MKYISGGYLIQFITVDFPKYNYLQRVFSALSQRITDGHWYVSGLNESFIKRTYFTSDVPQI